jgi:hypothetical protein
MCHIQTLTVFRSVAPPISSALLLRNCACTRICRPVHASRHRRVRASGDRRCGAFYCSLHRCATRTALPTRARPPRSWLTWPRTSVVHCAPRQHCCTSPLPSTLRRLLFPPRRHLFRVGAARRPIALAATRLRRRSLSLPSRSPLRYRCSHCRRLVCRHQLAVVLLVMVWFLGRPADSALDSRRLRARPARPLWR